MSTTPPIQPAPPAEPAAPQTAEAGSGSRQMQASQDMSLNELPPTQALALFTHDPVGFIQQIVGEAAGNHLADLKEQAELHGAMSAFRKLHPEFQRFEPFIVHEAVDLLQQGDSVASESWPKILEKAMENFKQKFSQAIQENQLTDKLPAQSPPYVEGGMNRVTPEAPANFTREQIGKMSMKDFLKNEAAINEALKNKRIK